MEELQVLIKKMIDSGEPEDDIATVINHYNKLESDSKVESKTEIEPPEKELYITSDFISRDEKEIAAYEEQELDNIKSTMRGGKDHAGSKIPQTKTKYKESEIIDLASKAQEVQDPNNLTNEEIERIEKNINSEKIKEFENIKLKKSGQNVGFVGGSSLKLRSNKEISDILEARDIDPEEYQSWLDGETNFVTDSKFEEAKEVFVNGRIKTFYNNMDDDQGKAVQKFIEYTKDEITEEVANVEEAEKVLNKTMSVNGWTQTEGKDGKKSPWTHPDIEEIKLQHRVLLQLSEQHDHKGTVCGKNK